MIPLHVKETMKSMLAPYGVSAEQVDALDHQGDPEKMLTVDEVAARMGVRRTTVFKLLRRGSLPRVKLGHRITRIPEQGVTHLLESATTNGQ